VRVALSWLEELVDLGQAGMGLEAWTTGGARRLLGALDELGLVVEASERVGAELSGVVVARVTALDPIAGADRIRRVVVDAGEEVQVVCGAWNFGVGDVVVLARPGAELAGGMRIAARRLRGVESAGMLCSPSELGLWQEAGGLLVLPPGVAEPGQDALDVPGLGPDAVLELAVEPNRPDALSVLGVARDLAAHLGLELRVPQPAPLPLAGPGEGIELAISDEGACSRLAAVVIDGLRPARSHPVVARRLALAGMRPLGAVVDASNYVMLELGQPTHPYDLSKLGGRALGVRRSRPGERLVTLDGEERAIGPDEGGPAEGALVIVDGADRPVGLAGVMGGGETEIDDGTSQVLLEVAAFSGVAVARTARSLGLRSEASVRFERGVDPEGLERAAARVAELVAGSAGGRVLGSLVVTGPAPARRVVRARPDRVRRVLGADVSDAEQRRLLEALGFGVRAEVPASSDGEGRSSVWSVEVPSWRPDVVGEADLAEEVGRLFGYDRIPRRLVRPSQVGALEPRQRARRRLADALVALGAVEVWSPTMVRSEANELAGLGDRQVRVRNPLDAESGWLRRGLLAGLLAALATNVDRRGERGRLFEIGHVFALRAAPADGAARDGAARDGAARDGAVRAGAERWVEERDEVGLLLAEPGDDGRGAWRAWLALADRLHLRDGVHLDQRVAPPGLHPGRSGELRDERGERLGVVGEVDPDVAVRAGVRLDGPLGWLGLDTEAVVARIVGRGAAALFAPSGFPAAEVDLAFCVPEEVSAEAVALTLAEAELVESVQLFDVFRSEALPKGTRSLAFRARFAAADRTLSEQEVAEVRSALIERVAVVHGARLRGG